MHTFLGHQGSQYYCKISFHKKNEVGRSRQAIKYPIGSGREELNLKIKIDKNNCLLLGICLYLAWYLHQGRPVFSAGNKLYIYIYAYLV